MRDFRKVCWTLHREIGFLVVGLTIVYAVSGIAVNHAHHWDANYARVAEPVRIEPPGAGPTADVEPLVLERLGLDRAQVKTTWRASPEVLQVFLEGGGYEVNLVTGEGVRKGQPVGQIHFLERPDREPVVVQANRDGVLIATRAPTQVGQGDCVACIASDVPASVWE